MHKVVKSGYVLETKVVRVIKKRPSYSSSFSLLIFNEARKPIEKKMHFYALLHTVFLQPFSQVIFPEVAL